MTFLGFFAAKEFWVRKCTLEEKMFEALRYSLKHNRKHVMKSATAWLLFGMIILVFVFWGLTPHQPGVVEGGAAAVVNETIISQADLDDMTERLSQDPRFQQFQAFGAEMARKFIQDQALSRLVQMELVNQQTKKLGLITSDAEVRDIITTQVPIFQEDGRFKRELYMRYLEAARKSAGEFESEIRRGQSLQRTLRMFSATLRPLSFEAEKTQALADMKANVEFVQVPSESLVKTSDISGSDADAYVADAKNAGALKDYYENHKEEFSVQEQVKARHILVQADAGAADAEKKALEKIQKIAERAKTEDFAKLATEFSEDPGSKSNGGLLGFFTRGRMVPEFEDVAFKLELNKISEPVKTSFGYHLIQVLEKKAASEQTLEEAKIEIAKKLLAKERSQKEVEALQTALNKSDTAAISGFVSKYNLIWQESGVFSVDASAVPKLGPNDEAVRVAFSLSAEKPYASALVRQGPTAYVLRYKDIPAEKNAKSDAKKQDPALVAEMMAGRRSEEVLGQWLDGLEKSAKVSKNVQFERAAPSN